MTLFSKPNTLLYVQRSSLILTGKRLDSARLDFPPEVVQNLEILAKPKFVELCQQFLTAHEIHGRQIIIVLDASIVSQKVIELDKSGQPDILIQAFIDAMPFDVGKRACLAVQNANSLRLFATNAELYTCVAEAVHAANAGKIDAITPATAYNLSKEDRNLSAATEQFFTNSEVRKRADFHTVTPV